MVEVERVAVVTAEQKEAEQKKHEAKADAAEAKAEAATAAAKEEKHDKKADAANAEKEKHEEKAEDAEAVADKHKDEAAAAADAKVEKKNNRCKKMKKSFKDLEDTMARCKTSPTCGPGVKAMVPKIVEQYKAKMKEEGC